MHVMLRCVKISKFWHENTLKIASWIFANMVKHLLHLTTLLFIVRACIVEVFFKEIPKYATLLLW